MNSKGILYPQWRKNIKVKGFIINCPDGIEVIEVQIFLLEFSP